MKVVTPREMQRVEKAAKEAGCQDAEFMESAGKGIAKALRDRYPQQNVVLLVGKGNNGGDTYVAGRYLTEWGYKVSAYQVGEKKSLSPLCLENFTRFESVGGTVQVDFQGKEMQLPPSGLLLDGLFGTGFRGDVRSPYLEILKQANRSNLIRIAIDIPSGLDGETGECSEVTFRAHLTYTLGFPKKGFFQNKGWRHVGSLEVIDFGLPDHFADQAKEVSTYFTVQDAKSLFPEVLPDRYKYEVGSVVGIGGAPSMSGAPLMASFAALKGGAGIVDLYYPEKIREEMATTPLEVMCHPYCIDDIPSLTAASLRADAVFIGPGMGREKETGLFVAELLANLNKPAVLDADALFWIGEMGIFPPKGSVLTPHAGEAKKLLGNDLLCPKSPDFLNACQEYADSHQLTFILKGAPTIIFHPGVHSTLSASGNPGLATAGTGDVLTGLLASLLAQGLQPFDAACLGVFLHGLAGDHATKELTPFCLTATDLFDFFPHAFRLEKVSPLWI